MSTDMPIHQTHGAIPATPSNTAKSTYEILNRGLKNPYTVDTVDEYTEQLSKMTLSQLHDHAVSTAKVIPIDDRERLIKRLAEEFGKFKSRTSRVDWTHNSNDDLAPEARESIEKILRKGRY